MLDFSLVGKLLGTMLGFAGGVLFAIILALLGHGWASLLAIPGVSGAGLLAGAWLDRR